MIVKKTLYVHGEKEYMYSVAEDVEEENDIEIADNIKDEVMYGLYEVALNVNINTETGEVDIVGCDGYFIDKTKKLV